MKEIIEKYYCPLTFGITYRLRNKRDDDSHEFENAKALEYLPQIAEFIESNDGGKMIDYFADCGIEKLKDIKWSVEIVNGILYGCIVAKLSEPLTFDEDKKLKRKIYGQNSDGFGESLEQKPLRMDIGDIYISFCRHGEKYFLYNEKEFAGYINGKQIYQFSHRSKDECENMWLSNKGKCFNNVVAWLRYDLFTIEIYLKSPHPNAKDKGIRANIMISKTKDKNGRSSATEEYIETSVQQELATLKSWEEVKRYLYDKLVQYCKQNSIYYGDLYIEEEMSSPDTKTSATSNAQCITKKRCPKCGAESFYVTAHVCQDWKVDCNGTVIETVDECSRILHQPDDDDIWTCANCGFDAAGSEFNVQEAQIPAPSRKRLLKIFGCTMAAYSFELEEYLVEANKRRLDKKIDEIIIKDFKMSESEMKSLHSLSDKRMIELIKKFIPAYELILREQDYNSEEDLHKVVLNEFGMTEEEYKFFTQD